MDRNQEPKYAIQDNQLVKRATGEALPGDEPIFILRGRDVHAVKVLAFYQRHCQDEGHKIAIGQRMTDFVEFRMANPDAMGEPDTTPEEMARPVEAKA